MPSISTTHVSAKARRASDGRLAQTLARTGLTARGVIYILIGWVAILLALGKTTRQADQRGALQLLAREPFGLVSLWLLGIGFAAHALWGLPEGGFWVTRAGERRRAAAEVPGPGTHLRELRVHHLLGDRRRARQPVRPGAGPVRAGDAPPGRPLGGGHRRPDRRHRRRGPGHRGRTPQVREAAADRGDERAHPPHCAAARHDRDCGPRPGPRACGRPGH